MDGKKIANLLQEGYRMPKPQHVDDKLYDNALLLFPDGFYRRVVSVPLFVRVYVGLKIKPSLFVELA